MLNSVILNGRLVKEIELENYGKGKNAGVYTKFSIAVGRGYKDENDEVVVDFINCTAFNNTAEILSKYVNKGDMVTISGRLNVDKYENKDGETRYSTYVSVTNVDLLPNSRETEKKKGKK